MGCTFEHGGVHDEEDELMLGGAGSLFHLTQNVNSVHSPPGGEKVKPKGIVGGGEKYPRRNVAAGGSKLFAIRKAELSMGEKGEKLHFKWRRCGSVGRGQSERGQNQSRGMALGRKGQKCSQGGRTPKRKKEETMRERLKKAGENPEMKEMRREGQGRMKGTAMYWER